MKKELLEEIENEIRAGRFDQVEKRLIKLGKIERKHAVDVANIARRVNRLNFAVKILNPIVRPTDKLQDPATVKEKIEYADTLRQLGAVDEAWELLSEIDKEKNPQVLFHQSLCLFNQWKYAETLPLLKEYVSASSLTGYQRIVGQVNLAAALIQQGHHEEAKVLLELLKKETQKSGALLMYGSSLELSAQIAIFEGNLKLALSLLEESSQVLKQTGRVVSLYVEKWKAIALSLLEKNPTQELKDVILKAHNMKHWETVRDCELYQASLTKDNATLLRLYFGTPYESFRQRIRAFGGNHSFIPDQYLHSKTSNPAIVLDLASGKFAGMKTGQLPLGHAMHKLLILLSQDFYKPVSLMSLFGKLFPGEYMNATTSANRVHQIVRRLRNFLKSSELPIAIEHLDGCYRLELAESIGFICPKNPLLIDSYELPWNILKTSIGQKGFTIQQVTEVLACSPSNARLLLRWALSENRIKKFGKSSQTSYQIVTSLRSAVA